MQERHSAMEGGSLKTKKRNLKEKPAGKNSPEMLRQSNEDGETVPDAVVPQLSARALSSPSKRSGRRDTRLTSTPTKRSSPDVRTVTDALTGADRVEPVDAQRITRSKTSHSHSVCTRSASLGGRRPTLSSTPEKRQRMNKTQEHRKKMSRAAKREDQQQQSSTEPRERRTQKSEQKTDEDESLVSSSVSIELSHQEEQLPCFSFDEDQEVDEEDEDLPSFLQDDRKPTPIKEGMFVWYKMKRFPYWPSLVKSVNRKQKKARILFIDSPGISTTKGFAVALRALKPFDCEEANDLVNKAKEDYQDTIMWSLELISDYRIRIACGSFSGSFLEYCAHDMSHPVMKTFPRGAAVSPTATINDVTEAPSHEGDDGMSEEEEEEEEEEKEAAEEEEDASRTQKRLLPDRSHAAHNRANQKLVNFIVKQRRVEKRLLAVIHGQQPSSWFQLFQSARGKHVVNTYLEDEQQMDQVYRYLNELYATAAADTSGLQKLKFIDLVSFILDVLLPEAIISAIAGVDNISLQKAEEKFLRGRSISPRETKEFDVMIERYMKSK